MARILCLPSHSTLLGHNITCVVSMSRHTTPLGQTPCDAGRAPRIERTRKLRKVRSAANPGNLASHTGPQNTHHQTLHTKPTTHPATRGWPRKLPSPQHTTCTSPQHARCLSAQQQCCWHVSWPQRLQQKMPPAHPQAHQRQLVIALTPTTPTTALSWRRRRI